MKRRLTHGSTFSGIGAAEIAAEILGWDNKFHCEINDFGRKILDFHFPRAESYGDIKQTNFTKWRGRIDVLTGGFPCQPFSTAGKRHGANDNRYLWGEMLRCITEIEPTWFIGENVVGITSMVLPCEAVDVGGQTDLFGTSDHIQESRGRFVLEEICRNLESIGYSVQPIVVPACAVSAPHRRDRIFILAHNNKVHGTLADSEGCPDLRRPREIPCEEGKARIQERNDVLIPGVAGEIPSEIQGTTQDPCCDRCDDNISEEESDSRRLWNTCPGDDVRIRGEERLHASDSDNNGLQHHLERGSETGLPGEESFGREDKVSEQVQPTSPNGNGRKTPTTRELIAECVRKYVIGRWEKFPTQPPLLRGHDGLPFDVDGLSIPFNKWRNETLKAYGNAIVPQVLLEIFKFIEVIENGN